MKKIAPFLCLLLLLQLLTGCHFSPPVAIFRNWETDSFSQAAHTQMLSQAEEANIPFDEYFANGDISLQLRQIQAALESRYKLLMVELAEPGNTEAAAQILEAAGTIPVLFYRSSIGDDGSEIALLDAHPTAGFLGFSPREGGIIQGRMIGEYVLENYESIDRNGDGVITYTLLRGDAESPESEERSRLAVEEADVILTDAGKIALSFFDPQNPEKYQLADWSADAAEAVMAENLTHYTAAKGNLIELVICNDDAMAAGAVAALQAQGYNLPRGGSIPVFGFGSTEDAQALIAEGALAGTVSADAESLGDALFTVMETVCGKHTIPHAIAALSTDDRFFLTADSLAKVYLIYSPIS